ncbi:MAG: glycosyltransferase family 2 protein [Nitrospirota bacterium]
MKIDIVLSTYNGERYLEEQVDSIISQTFTDWRLLIRDDGSSDTTVALIQKIRKRNPDKIILIDQEAAHKGACQSFAALMSNSKSDYLMFCDQDDIWLSDKINKTLAVMAGLEKKYGHHQPLLVHSDAKVVDHNLKELAPSLLRYQKIKPIKGAQLSRLFLQNAATGCTMMINKTLRDMALPVSSHALMHDWWLALPAAAFGHIGYVAEPTMLYRQHGKNDLGAHRYNFMVAVIQLLELLNIRKIRHAWRKKHVMTGRLEAQAKSFLHHYYTMLSHQDKEMLNAFCSLSRQSYLKKRYCMFRYGFLYTNVARNVGMFLLR